MGTDRLGNSSYKLLSIRGDSVGLSAFSLRGGGGGGGGFFILFFLAAPFDLKVSHEMYFKRVFFFLFLFPFLLFPEFELTPALLMPAVKIWLSPKTFSQGFLPPPLALTIRESTTGSLICLRTMFMTTTDCVKHFYVKCARVSLLPCMISTHAML